MADLTKAKKKNMHPTRVLALGFLTVILVGAVLLTLPIATTTGESVGFLAALFTATSCTCVTGLAVVETGIVYSVFGQAVMLVLIQVGGLGFMTAAALLFMLVGKRITLQNRLTIAEGLNESQISGMARLVRRVCALTAGIEFTGSVLLAFRFVPQFGWAKGLWFSVFHSVSAFCNAGFDLLGKGDSLVSYSGDPYVLIIITLLIVFGGLGFAVITDMWKKKRVSAWGLHTKIVVVMTAALIFGGAAIFLLAEYNNPGTLGPMGFGDKVVNAIFQSVTLRTAGFASISQANLSNASYLLCLLLMFIGASPASTGGGIKTTTFFVMLLFVGSVVKSRKNIQCFGRKLPDDIGRKVVAITFISLALVCLIVFGICLAEAGTGIRSDEIVYESISAFATVGTSMGITAALSSVSQILLIIGMFCGRVGPVTLAVAFSVRAGKEDGLRYPEEKIMVG